MTLSGNASCYDSRLREFAVRITLHGSPPAVGRGDAIRLFPEGGGRASV